MALLFESPNEIIVEILTELDPSDLLALRGTNHAFHKLVHKHASTLARMCRNSKDVQNLPQSSLLFQKGDIIQLMEVAFRRKLVASLASMMAERIVTKLKFRHKPFNEEEMNAWLAKKKYRLQAKFESTLLVLDDFILNMRRILLDAKSDLEYLSDEDYLDLGPISELDQQYTIEQIPSDALMGITQTWRVFEGIVMAKGVSMSCQGQTPPFMCVTTIIAFAGLRPFAKFLCEASFDRGANKLDEAGREMLTQVEVTLTAVKPPLATIHHLRRTSDPSTECLSPRRKHRIQLEFLAKQAMWESAAFAVMQRKGIVGPNSREIPRLETWIRTIMAEKGDPNFELGRWNRPDPVD